MPLLRTGTVGSGTPLLAYELYADNISGSGTKRTVRVTVKFKVNGSSASYYGYPCQWRARIQTPYEFVYGGWSYIKNGESWNGGQAWRSFSQDITFDSRSTGSIAILPGFETSSSGGWSGSAASSSNFATSITNTAPFFPSGAALTLRNGSANGEILTGIIPENISTIYASWTPGQDNEGGTLNYALNHNINDGGWGQINYSSNCNYKYSIGSGNEGYTYQYYVDIQDNGGLWSSKIYSTTLTKNKLTQATLSSSSSINYNTSSIQFAYGGAKNTNGNTSFTYNLSCNEVTVYNSKISSTPATVTIYKGGTVPSGAYIKFDDLKNRFKGSSFKGILNFVLTTTNLYETSKTSSKAINVDLRTEPNEISCSISNDKAISTAIKITADTKASYFIPNGNDVIRVSWSGGICKLGSNIKYDVQVKFGTGAFTTIASNLSSSVNYYNYKCPTQNLSQSLVFRVIATTEFSYSKYKDTAAITLHYYNTPSITVNNITRTDTTAIVPIIVKTNSSIPNINTVGSWYSRTTGNTAKLQTGNLSVEQTVQNINLSSLVSAGTYIVNITYNDKTGFSANQTKEISIGANLPVLQVNKYGVGVNGAMATSDYAVNVKGNVNTNASFIINSGNSNTGGFKCNGHGKSVRLVQGNEDYAWIETNANKGLYSNKNLYVNGEIYAGSGWNKRVYHEGYKQPMLPNFYSSRPTSADMPLTGDGGVRSFKATSSMTTNKPTLGDGHILNFDWDGTNGFSTQLFIKNSSDPKIQMRGMNNGTWGKWETVYSTTYKPTHADVNSQYINFQRFGTSSNATVTVDNSKFKNRVRVSFMTTNKNVFSNASVYINSTRKTWWQIGAISKITLDIVKCTDNFYFVESIVSNHFREGAGYERFTSYNYTHSGNVSSIKIQTDDNTTMENLVAMIEYC